MRILFFSHYFPPEGNAPASRTYENCKRWVEAGHDVTVVTCAPNCPDGVLYDGYKNRLRQRETIDGIEVVRVWTYIAANKGTFRRILNYISYMVSALFFSMFLKKPDITIATSPQFFNGWAGVLAGRLRRVPFILEIRDIWPESIVAVGAMQNKRAVRFLEWLEIKLYAAATHIVTVGEGYRQRLLEKGVEPERISIVMNGVDRATFFPRDPDADLIKKHNLQGKYVVSYIGTIGMACGLEVVLEAARKLKEDNRDHIVFLIVGGGAVREELEEKARQMNLDNVLFTGRQDKSLMPNYLSVTDVCFVHLRKTDLFTTVMPSKIFEAAGLAKPIILGVQGFAAQLVQKAGAGICIEPDDPGALLEALDDLVSHPEKAAALGRAGFENIAQKYDRDQYAADYLEILQNHKKT